MAGAPAAVGDDGRGRLHHRLPVGRRGIGDQDLAGLEAVQFALALDHPNLAAGDLGADGAAAQQHRRAALQHIVFQDLALALAGDRLGPCLHDVEFAVQAVLGPLDVHRHAMAGALRVVLLDLDGGVGQGQDVGVADAEALPVGLRRRDHAAGLAGVAVGVDHLELLLAAAAAEHGPVALLEGRLVNVVLVRVDRTLNHGFSQPVGAGDEDHVGKAGFRVHREDDAAGGQVGADHLHHRHRQRDLEVIEVALDAIADRPVGEERGEAALVGVDQQRLAAHVQVGVVLAREAGGRQILRGGRGAHGDAQVVPVLRHQGAPAFADLLFDFARQGGAVDQFADRVGAARQVVDVRLVEVVQQRVQAAVQVVVGKNLAIGLGRHGEAVRHLDAQRDQFAIHLAERGVLAADQRHVAQAQIGKPANVGGGRRAHVAGVPCCRRLRFTGSGRSLFTLGLWPYEMGQSRLAARSGLS